MIDWNLPKDYIQKRIYDIFMEVAKIASLMNLSEDESAGVPMAIFKAENHMLAAWRNYLASLSEPDNLKQINNEKETDRGPGLSGSERAADLAQLVESELRAIIMQREEIIRAFIAKYGCQPNEIEQIEELTETGRRWYLRKKDVGSKRAAELACPKCQSPKYHELCTYTGYSEPFICEECGYIFDKAALVEKAAEVWDAIIEGDAQKFDLHCPVCGSTDYHDMLILNGFTCDKCGSIFDKPIPMNDKHT